MQILGEDDRTVRAVADEFGVYLKPSSYGMDVKPLVKEACRCGWVERADGWMAFLPCHMLWRGVLAPSPR